MITPEVLIREKAQRVLMLQSLIKSMREQEDFDSMFETIAQSDHLAAEVQQYAAEHNLIEGLVVYMNATSFIYHIYNNEDLYSLSLPYSIDAAVGLLELLEHFEKNCPDAIDEFKAAHFIAVSLSQVIYGYLGALRVEANEDALYGHDILGDFQEIVCFFQGAFELLRQVAPQSKMLDPLALLYAKTEEWWKAEDRHRDLKTSDIISSCVSLFAKLKKIELQN